MAHTAAVHPGFGHAERRWVVGAGSLAYGLLLIRTAWVCDDAYVTFRTVWNFLHGYGLRWNVVNRVQAFTHPLWMFAMTGATAITGEYYFTSIALTIALSLAAVLLITGRIASSTPMALLAFSALAMSKGFVEYSTSGLENALTHLLLAAFFIKCAAPPQGRRRLLTLSFLASLLILNRLDNSLLVLPSLAAAAWRARRARPWWPLAAGMAPLAAWELFSLLYYGFLLPNTAYAKLGPGVPRIELLHQGLLYLLDSVGNDPVTLLVVLSALLSPLVFRASWEIPFGILLHLAYVLWVGGDFMSGRFLAAPFLCAVIHLARQPFAPGFSAGWVAAMSVVWIAGLVIPRPMILSSATFGDIKEDEAIPGSHVTDERRFYYGTAGLLNAHRGAPMPDHRWAHIGEADLEYHVGLVVVGPAGFVGFSAGPNVHLIDRYGLGDPLIARLPAEVPWQIGHFERKLPSGYTQTVASRRNLIENPGVAAYYERLRVITEEPIWSARRLRMILRMNLGEYDSLVADYGIVRTTLDAVSTPRSDGTPWNSPGSVIMTLRGATIAADKERAGGRLEVSVSGNDRYRVRFLLEDRPVAEVMIEQPLIDDGSLRRHVLDVPPDVRWNGLAVLPAGGDALYSLGHIRLLP